jgi:hypothetical protein
MHNYVMGIAYSINGAAVTSIPLEPTEGVRWDAEGGKIGDTPRAASRGSGTKQDGQCNGG